MQVYQFAGRGPNMPEDEIATIFVYANQDVRVTIEMVAPLSEEKALDTVFRVMAHSFSVGS